MLKRNQQLSAMWAIKMLANPNLAILDTETTGLQIPEIVELGIVSGKGEVLYNGRFRPLTGIEQGAAQVHGLTAAVLANEPTWAEQWEKIWAILDGRPLVIYNAEFDLRALDTTCRLHGTEGNSATGRPPYWCAMHQYARWVGEKSHRSGGYRWQKLPQFEGLPAHTAVGDALATLEVLKQMASAVDVTQTIPELGLEVAHG